MIHVLERDQDCVNCGASDGSRQSRVTEVLQKLTRTEKGNKNSDYLRR